MTYIPLRLGKSLAIYSYLSRVEIKRHNLHQKLTTNDIPNNSVNINQLQFACK